jgi:hypothetical protein
MQDPLDEQQTAERLTVSRGTLPNWRCSRTHGPAFQTFTFRPHHVHRQVHLDVPETAVRAILTEAQRLDPRLPRIIYLRRRGKTLRAIGAECGIDERTCRRLLQNAAPNLLQQCGLRKI